MDKKLVRSSSDCMIAGVCGGLGEYLGIDPTIIRLIFVLMLILGGHGLLVYIILWIIMPENKPVVPASQQVVTPPQDPQP